MEKESVMDTNITTLEGGESERTAPHPVRLVRPRLTYLDSLRTMMITAVVVTHLTITYAGTPVEWYYMEIGKTVPIVDLLVLFLGLIGVGFSMGLFFFIAGYFSPAAYDRKGPGSFLVDRLKKLGIAWLVCELVLVPALNYIVDIHGRTNCAGGFYDCTYRGSLLEYLKLYPANQGSISDGPDWFLEALLIFSVGYLLWRLATRSVKVGAIDVADRARTVPGNWAIALFALVIGVSTYIVRFWVPVFTYFPPWNLEFAHFPQYIALFAAGAWAYRRDLLNTFTDRQARSWHWVALVCVLVLPAILSWVGALSGEIDPQVAGGVTWMSLVYSLWEGFLCVSVSITFFTWYRRRFSHQSRMGHAMSESAFAVYIFHPAVVVPLTLALSGIQMNRSFKFLLVAPIAVALSYLVVHLLRKLPAFRFVFG
jgi:surface polysaccharide O-acyltransferase-like enzyme